MLPIDFGKTEKRTHDYVRHGTTNLFAALDTATGEVLGECYARRRTEEFLKFMDAVVKRYPDQEIQLFSTICRPIPGMTWTPGWPSIPVLRFISPRPAVRG